MSDLLIRGGQIVDGTRARARAADLRVRAGVIQEIGPGLRPEGETEIDARGCYVTPGFIEQHTHYDASLWWDPFCDPMPAFGTTTCVIGNCGHSLAPIRAKDRGELIDLFCFIEDLPNKAFEQEIPWKWEDWPEYGRAARAHPIAVNAAPLVGYSPIRIWVMGEAAWEREATQREIAEMSELLRRSLAAGAFGMGSAAMDLDRSGRPVPSRIGSDEERRTLFRLLAEERRVAMHALRLMEAEHFESDLVTLGEDVRATGVRALWAALMSTPGEEALRASILALHRRQRAEGLDIWGQTPGRPQHGAINFERSILFQGIDAWHEMVNADAASKMRMLEDPAWRKRARHDWDHVEFCIFPVRALHALAVGHCAPHNQHLRGMPLDAFIAERGDGHPSDLFADWLVDNGIAGTGFSAISAP